MILAPARPAARHSAERGVAARALQVAAVVTVGMAPVEGYLLEYSTVLTKVPAGVLVVIWLWWRVWERRLPVFHPVHVPLAVLAATLFATSALHSGAEFTFLYLQRWVAFLVTAVVLLDVMRREVPVRHVLAASIVGGLAAGIGALVSFVVVGDLRATGPMEDPNDLAYVLVAALPLLLAFGDPRWARRHRAAWRVALAVAGLLLVLGAAVTLSRGGAVALGAVLVVALLHRVLSRQALLVAAGLLLAGAAVLLVSAGPLVVEALSQKRTVGDANADTRELRWEVALRMVPGEPLLGVGPGGFRSGYMAFSTNAELVEQTPVAHNMYVEVLAELGLLGSIGFCGTIAVAVVAVTRAVRRHPARGAGGPRAVPLAVQGSLVAVLVASIFLSEQYYMPLWAMIAAACAIDLRGRTESRT